MVVTVRLRGEFKDLQGNDGLELRFNETHITCEAVRARLSGLVAAELLQTAALFRGGRLLRPYDSVLDGDIIHVLSPYAGG